MSRLVTFFALVSAVLSIGGCGSQGTPRIPISGVVELDGKPLEGASVAFIAGGGAVLSTAMTDSEGKFTAKVGEGTNKVSVSKIDPKAAAAAASSPDAESSLMGTEAEVKAQAAKRPKSQVPERYTDPTTSGLSFDIQKGMEPLLISLVSK
ncbi:MAG: hypothetical protein ACTHOU_05225 [Aureliella sp.]